MQHDYNIANDSGANVRADLNNVLAAIKTMNSGATAPSATSAGMSWFDTSDANTWYWKLRNNSDDGWINVGALDVATDVFQPMIDDDLITTYLTDNFYTETEVDTLLNVKANAADVPNGANSAITDDGTNITVSGNINGVNADNIADTTNFKTVDGQSILGGGDISVGDTVIDIDGRLTTSGELAKRYVLSKGAAGTYTTMTVALNGTSTSASVIVNTVMCGYSGKEIDHCFTQYSTQPPSSVLRSSSSVPLPTKTGDNLGVVLSFNISAIHPLASVEVIVGGNSGYSCTPTITFS